MMSADAPDLRTGYNSDERRSALRSIVVAWIFGAAFFAVTGGPAFASFLKQYLQVDDLHYGLILAAGPAASVFWFLGSYVVERSGRSKPVFMWFGTAHRLVWLGVAATPLLLRHGSANLAMQVVVAATFVSAAAANFGGVGWWTWMSGIVPRTLAGRYFGRRTRLGMLSMLTAVVIVSLLLDRFQGRGWIYAVVFSAAALMGATDILLFANVPEVPRGVGEVRPTLLDILVTPWREPRFRILAAYLAAAWVAYAMTGGFLFPFCFAKVADRGLGLTVVETTALVVVLPQLLTAWVAPAWGRAIDRYGPKSALRAGSLSAVVLPFMWICLHRGAGGCTDLVWMLPVSMAFAGLLVPGIDQALAYMQLHEFPEHRRTAYTAAFQVVIGLAAVVGSSLGGVIARFWSTHLDLLFWRPIWLSQYHLVFAASLAIRLAAFGLLFHRLPMTGRAGSLVVVRSLLCDLFHRAPAAPDAPSQG